MIQVEHLTKQFGDTTVLDDISFTIQKGEIVGFLGPNGAGKTTTMRIITGYIAQSKGTVTIDGNDVQKVPVSLRKRIGYLPENNPLYESMRVAEYLEFVGRIKGVANLQSDLRRVVRTTHIGEKLNSPISELSKGFRQRVGLADALLGSPDILILDEPTSGLDPNQTSDIRSLIREIGRTQTILFSTHILQEAQAACDRVLIIDHGRIVGQGTVDELVRQTQGKTQVNVVIEGPGDAVLSALRQIPGALNVSQPTNDEYNISCESDTEMSRAVFLACKEHGWILLRMASKRVSLEDVFRELTNERPSSSL